MIDVLMLAAALGTASTTVTMQSPTMVAEWKDSGSAQVWDGVPKWVRALGYCIRKHESHHNYRAEDPISTASGAYSFINATWVGNARWTKVAGNYVARGYAHASKAPAWVQDAVFIHTIRQGGIKAWRGTGCRGTA